MPTDLVISFDTTGSMATAINQVRSEVENLLDNIFEEIDDLRVCIFAQGDYKDKLFGSYDVTDSEFTNNKEELVNFVKNIPTTNGYDWQECYELLFHKVWQLDWRETSNKIFIFIADAEPHLVSEPLNTLNLDWQHELNIIASRGIQCYAVQCLRNRRSDYLFETAARLTNGIHVQLDNFGDILQYLYAMGLKQASNDAVLDYGQALKSKGMLNRSIARLVEQLTNDDSLSSTIVSTNPDGLEPVESSRFQFLNVSNDIAIRSFVEEQGITYKLGKGFYQLSKVTVVQENKEVVLLHKESNELFGGAQARNMLGLPYGKRGKLYKTNIPDGYIVFIQSTSVNRKLIKGTKFLYEVDHR